MAAEFNPYREWLGLESGPSSPTYYQLLGIGPDESDVRVIQAAADRALAHVRSHRPGVHARVWAALLDELAAAKNCLTDPELRRRYDSQRAGEEALRETARLAAVVQGSIAEAMAPYEPLVEFAADVEESPVDEEAAKGGFPPPFASAAPAASCGLTCTSADGTVTATAVARPKDAPWSAAPVPLAGNSDAARRAPPGRRVGSPLLLGILGGVGLLSAAGVYQYFAETRPTAREERTAAGESIGAAGTDLSRAALPPESAVVQPIAREELMAEPPIIDSPPPLVVGQPHLEEFAPDTESVSSVAESPMAPVPVNGGSASQPPEVTLPTAEQQAAFRKTLEAARHALHRMDFERGEQLLTEAETFALLPEQRARLADLRLLARYAARFAESVQEAATTLPAATQVRVGGNMLVSIVETGPKQIVVRVSGRNRRYPVDQLPVGLAAALGEHVSGSDPDVVVRKAAYLLLHPETDQQGRAKARDWLRTTAATVPEAARILAAVE